MEHTLWARDWAEFSVYIIQCDSQSSSLSFIVCILWKEIRTQRLGNRSSKGQHGDSSQGGSFSKGCVPLLPSKLYQQLS